MFLSDSTAVDVATPDNPSPQHTPNELSLLVDLLVIYYSHV